eukprot:GHRQ01037541.1.p1 GENE.GHRQ01037541.1~~GHRQ01037541.1.p1  ORF type:complete len:182 (+),score=51.40 GHRQ01037541.1:86-631(+)
MAESREWQLLAQQLGTPKGFKLLQVCHMVLRHTQGVLSLMPPSFKDRLIAVATTPTPAAGSEVMSSASAAVTGRAAAKLEQTCQDSCSTAPEPEARQLLACMCEERLMPTHWLNENIQDPLYLRHRPQYYLIQEHAEAARYPGLFGHRLNENKPNWKQFAQQLQLPAPLRKTLQLQDSLME